MVKDHALVSAAPIVKMAYPLNKVIREAGIGSVDHKELEALMANGLDPEEATELIVSGML